MGSAGPEDGLAERHSHVAVALGAEPSQLEVEGDPVGAKAAALGVVRLVSGRGALALAEAQRRAPGSVQRFGLGSARDRGTDPVRFRPRSPPESSP